MSLSAGRPIGHSDRVKPVCPVPQCLNSSFVNLLKFKRHWKEKHEKIAEVYPCTICGLTYSRRESLARHLRVKHPFDGQIALLAENAPTTCEENKYYIDPAPFTLEMILETQ